ncbi:hypothetical protein GGR50DRAFT_215697 [Xylaria sp. CBS 124048]|nr:hypothetical protein GGR50DRAFT_215697 [Xylaria sp. CBS 124048]
MPTERRPNPYSVLDYGASVAGENVDFAADSSMAPPGNRDRALMDRLKEALRPADARRFSADEGQPGGGGGDSASSSRRSSAGSTATARRGGPLDELGGGSSSSGGGGASGGGSSILGTLGGGFKRRDEGHGGKSEKKGGGGGGDSGSARLNKYRDSSGTTRADENRLPGNFYQTIRDEFGG